MSPDYQNNIVFSLIVVVRNERECLTELLRDLAAQDFPQESTEIILVNSASVDGTQEAMQDFVNQHPHRRVNILQNPKRLLASGWNLAIRAAKGRYVLRLDAHTRVPGDFLARNLDALRNGEPIVGGRIIYVKPSGIWKLILFLAASSRFGAAPAAFRQLGAAGYVDTIAFAAYSRYVFDKVGLFHETLARTEDNEMHYRIRKAGFKFYYDPAIVSYYLPRRTLRGLLRQMYNNGFWIFPTMVIQPMCFSFRHLIPFFFVLGLILAGASAVLLTGWFLALVLSVYFLTASAFAAKTTSHFRGYRKAAALMVPLIFFLIHSAYGIGSLVGVGRSLRMAIERRTPDHSPSLVTPLESRVTAQAERQ
jgi:GT2 family glycosyltransferase